MEEQDKNKEIARDKALSHAVEAVEINGASPKGAGLRVEEMMAALNARAMRADMVIINTTMLAAEGLTFIIAQWMERSKMEALQRQQILMGGAPTNGGRRH